MVYWVEFVQSEWDKGAKETYMKEFGNTDKAEQK